MSVITVCFNAAETLGTTIASVAKQSYEDYEHLIIDGGSLDKTHEIVTRGKHGNLTFISEPDQGIYDAMNKGLKKATGDYVVFLNADDFFASPDTLRLVAETAKATGADCIIGDTQFVNSAGIPAGRYYSTWGFNRAWIRFGVMPPHPSFFAKTALLRKANGFDLRYRISSDFDLVARILLVHRASWARIPAVLTNFRAGGVSTQGFSAKRKIGRETAQSLEAIGVSFSSARVALRYVPKTIHFIVGWFLAWLKSK